MTDEKIKEEFERALRKDYPIKVSAEYQTMLVGHDAVDFAAGIGFYAGFRAAERLAKIEELEDMSRMMDKLRFFSVADYKDAKNRIETMIAELKEAGE